MMKEPNSYYDDEDEDEDYSYSDKNNGRPSEKQLDDMQRQITTGLRSTELAMGREPSYDEEGHLLGRVISVPGTLSKPHPKPPSPESDYFRSPSSSDIADNLGVIASDETRGENHNNARIDLLKNAKRDKDGMPIKPSYGDIGAAQYQLSQNNINTRPLSPVGVMQPSQTQLPTDARFIQSNEFLHKYGTPADVARIARRNEGVTVKNPKLKKMIRETIMEALVREFVGDPSRPPSPPTPAMRGKKRRPPQIRRTLTQKEVRINEWKGGITEPLRGITEPLYALPSSKTQRELPKQNIRHQAAAMRAQREREQLVQSGEDAGDTQLPGSRGAGVRSDSGIRFALDQEGARKREADLSIRRAEIAAWKKQAAMSENKKSISW